MKFAFNMMLILAMLMGLAGCCEKTKGDTKACMFLFGFSSFLGFIAVYCT